MKIYEVRIIGIRDEHFTFFFATKAEAVKTAKEFIEEDNRLNADWEKERGVTLATPPQKFSEDMVNAIDIKPNKKGLLYFANVEARASWLQYAGGEPFTNWE
jgi:hypothetical protein